MSCVMGRQFTHQPDTLDTDLYVPVFTFLQISFYIGWLKVNPNTVEPLFGDQCLEPCLEQIWYPIKRPSLGDRALIPD